MHSSKTIWTWALVCVCCTVHTSVVLLFLWELAQLLTGQIPSSSSSCFSIQDKNLAIFASILYNRIFLFFFFFVSFFFFHRSHDSRINSDFICCPSASERASLRILPNCKNIYISSPPTTTSFFVLPKKTRRARVLVLRLPSNKYSNPPPVSHIFITPIHSRERERERERTTFSFFSFFQCFIVSILIFFCFLKKKNYKN